MLPGMKRLLALLLLLAGCAGDRAGSCALDLVAEVPVRLAGNVPLVLASINGQPAVMILDTGSDTTLLSVPMAQRLALRPAGPPALQQAAGGRSAAIPVRLQQLALGDAVTDDVGAMVGQVPTLDGVVGLNILGAYELDLDVPSGRATFYRARPCADARPPWTEAYTQLGIQQMRSGHMFVQAQLDGRPVRGMLDTGASSTIVSLATAQDAGVTMRELRALPAARAMTLNASGMEVRPRTFASLRIGPDELPSPRLLVADVPAGMGDIVVGGDYLATRRLWFSFITGRVFVAQPRPR